MFAPDALSDRIRRTSSNADIWKPASSRNEFCFGFQERAFGAAHLPPLRPSTVLAGGG